MGYMKNRLGWLLIGGLSLAFGFSAALAQDATPDLTNLPLGDGKVSTSVPQVGYIFVCNSGDPNGGGAGGDGPWINSSAGTFDYTQKAIVDGAVAWPDHELTITLDGAVRRISTNDLPDHTTGVFPIASGDDAYQYDRNPNAISTQTFAVDLPANPTAADAPSCVSGGPIGVTISGSLIFDGLDAQNRDAVAHETQDHCQGHPQQNGEYHYHNLSSCILDSL
ncbi:MAG: YHYH protein, partial [Chloroflexota bacterium]